MLRTGFCWVVAAVLTLPLFACERDPLGVDCPEVSVGGLVITEVRGDQDGGADDQGEWIELFNASGATIDLVGLRLVMKTLNGSSEEDFTIRGPLSVPNSGYATFGRFPEGEEPPHISYGYATELDTGINTTGAIEVIACGIEIDQVVYQTLPGAGTLAFDGSLAPDATANDSEANFCVDATDAGEGSPQQENPPCT